MFMKKINNVLFSLHLLLLASSLSSSLAKGGAFQSLLPSDFIDRSNVSRARRLLEDGESRARVDLAQGYMTNSDLERVIKEFGQRCSNISRIYRDSWRGLLVSGKV